MGLEFRENGNAPQNNATVSWKDMFHSASSLSMQKGVPRLFPSFSSPALHYNERSGSADDMKGGENMAENMAEKTCSEVRFKGQWNGSSKAMDEESDRGSGRRVQHSAHSAPIQSEPMSRSTLYDDNFQLAIYIAMAHAGLALVVVVLYGVGRLLKDFWKPIQWAVLCSMPLREVQEAIVIFWEEPLRVGMVESAVAGPIAIYRALLGTLLDAREGLLRFVGKGRSLGQPKPVGFAKLCQWLVAFAFCTLGLDILGPANLALCVFVGLLMYAGGAGFEAEVSHLRIALSQNGRLNRNDGNFTWVNWALAPVARTSRAVNTRISRSLIGSLHTLVAVGLITTMIMGSLGGLALFTYKVGMEGKDAVVMVKVHLEENDYAEVVGFNNWLEQNRVPELIDTYVGQGYDAIMDQVDSFAAKNNLTDFVDVGKELLRGFISGDKGGETNETAKAEDHPLLGRLHELHARFRAFDFQGVVSEIEATFMLFLEHFQMRKEDFLEKAKQVARKSSDLGKRILSSGTNMVHSGASAFIFVSGSIASGAAELFNFVTQSVIFFSVLYYLITSKTGGVMQHVLEMVPLSDTTRRSCANVLDHAVSSVLLATVKTAFFQASFTWLLFRFCDIHFLYASTLIALVQAFLPLFPNWVATIPLVVELCLERNYIGAAVLMIVHIWVMDYGVEKIQGEIPGHNAYLTGLSIAGGLALFTPALEGAIMGPLLMTVLISTKNLYAEFVLTAEGGVD